MFIRHSTGRSRNGITLVELLVIIVCLVILIAIMLPAMRRAGTISKRDQSRNNLKQLALAAHNYHDAYKILPWAGSSNTRATTDNPFSGSWAYQILPYLDQQNLHEMMTGEDNPGAAVKVGAFCCQMRNRPGICKGDPCGPQIDYAINTRINDPINAIGSVEGTGIDAKRNLKSIKDGAANTVLFGHQSIPTNFYLAAEPTHDFLKSIMVGATSGSSRGWSGNGLVVFQKDPREAKSPPFFDAAFGGPAAEGGIFAMCDGSVRVIPYDFNTGVNDPKTNPYIQILLPDDGNRPVLP